MATTEPDDTEGSLSVRQLMFSISLPDGQRLAVRILDTAPGTTHGGLLIESQLEPRA